MSAVFLNVGLGPLGCRFLDTCVLWWHHLVLRLFQYKKTPLLPAGFQYQSRNDLWPAAGSVDTILS